MRVDAVEQRPRLAWFLYHVWEVALAWLLIGTPAIYCVYRLLTGD